MTETKVVVNCTNCGESTEVPEKYAGHYEGDGASGLCDDCAKSQELPPREKNSDQMSGYEQVMHDQRGAYREKQQQLQP